MAYLAAFVLGATFFTLCIVLAMFAGDVNGIKPTGE